MAKGEWNKITRITLTLDAALDRSTISFGRGPSGLRERTYNVPEHIADHMWHELISDEGVLYERLTKATLELKLDSGNEED